LNTSDGRVELLLIWRDARECGEEQSVEIA
jgi:hypothetical protein